MFYSAEQIKGGGRCGGGCSAFLLFQPLCSLTPVQFYILPARLTHAHAETHTHSHNLHRVLHHTCKHTSGEHISTPTHAHTHTKNNCFCFALYLAGVQVIRPSREIFLIHSESICLHSLCAFARPSLGTHRSTKMPPLSL